MSIEPSGPVAPGGLLDAAADHAFDYWRELIDDLQVPLTRWGPARVDAFRGAVSYGRYDDVEVALARASAFEARRTRWHIGGSGDHRLCAYVQTAGWARLEADGRTFEVGPGEMVLFDSMRPASWAAYDDFEQVSVRVPLRRLREHSGLRRLEMPGSVRVSPDSPLGVVARFLRGVAYQQLTHPEQAAALAAHAVPMLTSALLMSTAQSTEPPALTAQEVLAFIRARYTDPELTVDRIAAGCAVSRRTLYRVCEAFDGGIGAVLRRMRVRHARNLLRVSPTRTLSAIAQAAGFVNERQFYRAFRQETGMTPGEYRFSLR
ncbi:helix-turn-helix domain-containing protein [Nocardia sp. XZ_19_385]|uniref:helix-turn-helix domain-containing protein n=1 Tax=Nocardia sp. XZ_19_385 TaxID=2769488 RepID=UPI0018906257|nr:helix-turn-helix domain-containing protein [Nocardia sp. XZ_19_385]